MKTLQTFQDLLDSSYPPSIPTVEEAVTMGKDQLAAQMSEELAADERAGEICGWPLGVVRQQQRWREEEYRRLIRAL